MRHVIILLVLAHSQPVLAQPSYEAADEIDLLPTPRELELLDEEWDVGGWQIVLPPHPPALLAVAADEINARLLELGASPLRIVHVADERRPTILLGRWWDPHIREAATVLDVHLAPNDPGEQGYVIEYGEYADRPVVLIGGSDAHGVLYGAVTFRRLLQRRGGGVRALKAHVRDWPDFKIRDNGMIEADRLAGTGATLQDLAPMERAVSDLKRQIDFYLRHKVNYLRVRTFSPDAGADPELHQYMQEAAEEVFRYAAERGIKTRFGGNVEVGKYLSPEQWEAAVERRPGTRFMWAAFDAHRKKANYYGELARGGRAGLFSLHPLDSGFLPDPEKWSQRSPQTRAMYGDDRARAQLEQFMLYFDAVRQKAPDIALEAVVYPYHFQIALDDFADRYQELAWGMPNTGKYTFLEDKEHARRVQNEFLDFHRYMEAGLPDEVYIVFREAGRQTFDATAALYEGHPITIWIYPNRNFGWYGTFTPQVRMAKTFWDPSRRDYYYVASSWTRYTDSRVHRLAQQEYLWNVDRPDASDEFTLFSRFYENRGRDITEFQRRHLIPRITRIIYDDAAPLFAQLAEANLSLHYVSDPEFVAGVSRDTEYFDEPYKYMEEQADAFDRLHRAFAASLADVGGANDVDAWTIYFYRYTGLAALKAKLEASAAEMRRLAESGREADAARLAQQMREALPELAEKAGDIRSRSDSAWSRIRPKQTFAPPYKGQFQEDLDSFSPSDFQSVFASAALDAPGKESPYRRAGQNEADIGANVPYRYGDRELTQIPLWNPSTGEFPHDGIVPGINDIAGSSAFDVHKRLNVSPSTFPPNY